jgi:hypothetical protein
MRYCGILFVVLLVSGCGEIGLTHGPWPASIISIQNMTDAQKTAVIEAIHEMNTHANMQMIIDSESSTNGPTDGVISYPITISLVPVSTSDPNRAGYATVQSDRCDVQLSAELFAPDRQGFVKPVVWHELGHCAGLLHVATQGEIMYPTSASMEQYTADAIQRFFKNILQSAGL